MGITNNGIELPKPPLVPFHSRSATSKGRRRKKQQQQEGITTEEKKRVDVYPLSEVMKEVKKLDASQQAKSHVNYVPLSIKNTTKTTTDDTTSTTPPTTSNSNNNNNYDTHNHHKMKHRVILSSLFQKSNHHHHHHQQQHHYHHHHNNKKSKMKKPRTKNYLFSSFYNKAKTKSTNRSTSTATTTTAEENSTNYSCFHHHLSKANLVTLGTIELKPSCEDLNYNDYDYYEDDDINNHALSSCGSVVSVGLCMSNGFGGDDDDADGGGGNSLMIEENEGDEEEYHESNKEINDEGYCSNEQQQQQQDEDIHSTSFITAHSTALSSSYSSSSSSYCGDPNSNSLEFDVFSSSCQSIKLDDNKQSENNDAHVHTKNHILTKNDALDNLTTKTNNKDRSNDTDTAVSSNINNTNEHHNDNHNHAHYISNEYFLAKEQKNITTLLQLSKEYYLNGSYKDALQIQEESFAIVLRHISEYQQQRKQKQDYMNNDYDGHEKQINLFQRQAAMIQYEIAKIEFVMYKEIYYLTQSSSSPSVAPAATTVASSNDKANSITSSSLLSTSLVPSEDDKQLSRLFEKMQNAKFVFSFQELAFYKDQLLKLDQQQQEQKEEENDCMLLLSKRIDVLNAIGNICFKNLHQYDEALKYYTQVLELEVAVFKSLSKMKQERNDNNTKNNNSNTHNMDDLIYDNLDDEIHESKIKLQQTKKKIGAIYYLSGRFDLALLSSFSL